MNNDEYTCKFNTWYLQVHGKFQNKCIRKPCSHIFIRVTIYRKCLHACTRILHQFWNNCERYISSIANGAMLMYKSLWYFHCGLVIAYGVISPPIMIFNGTAMNKLQWNWNQNDLQSRKSLDNVFPNFQNSGIHRRMQINISSKQIT